MPATVAATESRGFYDAVSGLARAFQFRDREVTCYGDLTVTECYALETILHQQPLLVGGLAARMHLNKSNASRVARALEAKGHVERRGCAGDTRAIELRVTPRGRRVHAAVRERLETAYRGLLAEYPPAVRRAVTEILTRLKPGGVSCGGTPQGGETRC
jgi:DNA-binding MarR family transcriptional regulator